MTTVNYFIDITLLFPIINIIMIIIVIMIIIKIIIIISSKAKLTINTHIKL